MSNRIIRFTCLFCIKNTIKTTINIGIYGSGKAAESIVSKLDRSFKTFLFARNRSRAAYLTNKYNIHLKETPQGLLVCDVVILAVSDDALNDVTDHLKGYMGLAVHLAGSMSIDNINLERSGVMWPLQSLIGSRTSFEGIPFFCEVKKMNDQGLLEILINQLGGYAVKSNLEMREKMHLSAVITHNFGNQLFIMAENLVGRNHVQHLMPILKGALDNWETSSARETQTGPAIRKDNKTIEKHLGLIGDNNDMSALYRLMTKIIQKQNDELQD